MNNHANLLYAQKTPEKQETSHTDICIFDVAVWSLLPTPSVKKCHLVIITAYHMNNAVYAHL